MRHGGATTRRALAGIAHGLLRPLASDEAGAKFWGRHVRVGVAITESSAAFVLGYVFFGDRPHRGALLVIAAVVMAGSPLMLAIPTRVLSSGVMGPLIFYVWSIGVTGVVALIALLDGGAESPLLWLLVLTMTFSALAYPPPGVLLMGAIMVGTYLGVVYVDGALSAATLLVAATLTSFTAMTAWVARNHWETYEQQVLLAARMAELDHTREEFVATTSHELRTPVASILGYVELLEDSAVSTDPNLPGFLAKIRRNAERLQGLSEDLLVLCHWDSDERTKASADAPVGETDMVEVAGRVLETMAPLASRQQVTLSIEVPDEWLPVMGAPDQLERAMLNLVSNAVKYTPAGGVVSCRLTRAGSEVLIEVDDNGIGIAEEELEALFRRFFRASSAREQSIAGVGLGLSIVHEIVTSLGGQIHVSSRLGRGTSFVMRLPCSAGASIRVLGQPSQTTPGQGPDERTQPGSTSPLASA